MEYDYNWIKILSALLTPTIAIAGLTIAWLQYRTNDQKRKNELFDRRYDFYKSIEEVWLSTHDVANRTLSIEDLIPFASEAEILFDKNVAEHILSLEHKRHEGSPLFSDVDFSRPFLKYLKLK